MTDLQGRYYATVLPQTVKTFVLTYEEAIGLFFRCISSAVVI